MIRFIDLTDQIIDGHQQFAFFNTVTDKFEEFSGCQTWDGPAEFRQDYDGDEVDRYMNLIPDRFLDTSEHDYRL